MKYRVLYFEQAPWKVGEREEDRDARLAAAGPLTLRDCYPGTFPGQVISRIPAGRRYSPADLTWPGRREVVLDLEKADAGDVAAGRKYLDPATRALREVTFDHRHGRLSGVLRANFADPEAAERESQNPPAEIETWEGTEGWRFAELLALNVKMLPQTDVHSGAGLYKVDASGSTHNDTIASFNDNLCFQSEDFTATWEVANAIVTPNQVAAPDGQTTADKITDDGDGSSLYQSLAGGALTDNLQYTVSVFVEVGTTPDFTLILRDTGASVNRAHVDFQWISGVPSVKTEDVGTGGVEHEGGLWYRIRITCPVNVIVGANAHRIYLKPTEDGGGASGLYMYTWGAQINVGASTSAYKPTRSSGDTQVTLTTGGLTDGDRDGEVFASGGNSYAVIRNGTDSVLVVGDPTGESGACTVSPYTTIQSSLDQLWTDQGSTEFTASQYIRIFAGTYDENVEPNAALNPDELDGYGLIIEGDPTDVRTNIVIAPSAGTSTFTCSMDQVLLRHLKIAGTPVSYMIKMGSGAGFTVVDDCVISGAKHSYLYNSVHFRDCSIETTANTMGVAMYYGQNRIEGCTIKGPGESSSTLQGVFAQYGALSVEGSVIHGFRYGIDPNDTSPPNANAHLRCVNVTIYDCQYGVRRELALGTTTEIVNTIMKDVTYCIGITLTANWPEETATHFGPEFTLRNNCFHGYTSFAYDGTTAKSHTEFTAFDRVHASGDLDATDPLLTDAAGDDFSLQVTSPCRHRGTGSGILKDHLETLYHPYHPDIGGWSSGAYGQNFVPKTPDSVNWSEQAVPSTSWAEV